MLRAKTDQNLALFLPHLSLCACSFACRQIFRKEMILCQSAVCTMFSLPNDKFKPEDAQGAYIRQVNFRGSYNSGHAPFVNFVSGHVHFVHWHMLVKFEVSSFNRIEATP